ncbi:MAG: alpha/beta hydrolase [Opitutaceae bacterium]
MKPTTALALITALLLGKAAFAAAADAEANTTSAQDTSMTTSPETDHYTFALSAKVTRQKVMFANRYGIRLTGDLYLPNGSEGKTLPAIAISGPFGAVKEQSSGLYANVLAERGYAVLAFDPSYTGESGGEPRNLASADINTEDFSAAVDCLGLHPRVDRNRIGILGICGFGGFALNAAAVDKRIKAVVTSTMYDISRVAAKGYNDSVTREQRTQMLEQISAQRWKDAETGTPAYGPRMNELKGGEPQFLVDYHDYYRTPRGFHPRSINSNGSWSATTMMSLMNMPILTYIAEISPRPILLIHGEKAHSRYFSETAYAAAAEPKELLIVPGANHVDLYDRVDVIPFAKIADFFAANLK